MTIFIGYESAYEFWRQADDGWRVLLDSSRSQSAYRTTRVTAKRAAMRSELEQVRTLGWFAEPIHIMVPTCDARRRPRGVVCHVCTSIYPAGSFVALEKGLAVASPALTFLQMARSLSVERLAVAGTELCSRYAISDEGFLSSREPLTSRSRLESFIERAKGAYGVDRARRALRFVVDDSASPMETVLALLLSMPRALGGYGLPKPVMNMRINAAEYERGMLGSAARPNFFKGDICWPKANVCVEYDSDAFHTGSDRIAHDSWRRSELGLTGFSVITVTKGQLYDCDSLDRVARLLAKSIGVRVRKEDAGYKERQRRLREVLLYK
ncbi:MAG: hypothetical protein Q4B69_01110 [Slackia sp.]|nr:hypothetical protein [Slackia sp.]